MLSKRPVVFIVAFLSAIVLLGVMAPSSQAVTFNPFVTSPPGAPIGFSFGGDKFVGTIQKDGTGVLYSTDLNGVVTNTNFAPGLTLPGSTSSEHYIAADINQGGFSGRNFYVAASNSIFFVSHDGSSNHVFVSGLNGDVRSIVFDPVGTWGNQMLAATTAGTVYQINSSGVATPIAQNREDTEGLDIAPLGKAWGPYAGFLFSASEGSGSIRAISPAVGHAVTNFTNKVVGVEELSFVPPTLGTGGSEEGMYGANYTINVLKADASQFAGKQGDLFVTSEAGPPGINHGVFDLTFNGTDLDGTTTPVTFFTAQPEDGLFVTAAHTTVVPLPSSLMLFGPGLGLLGLVSRKIRRS
jgi:hypothetical protein